MQKMTFPHNHYSSFNVDLQTHANNEYKVLVSIETDLGSVNSENFDTRLFWQKCLHRTLI